MRAKLRSHTTDRWHKPAVFFLEIAVFNFSPQIGGERIEVVEIVKCRELHAGKLARTRSLQAQMQESRSLRAASL